MDKPDILCALVRRKSWRNNNQRLAKERDTDPDGSPLQFNNLQCSRRSLFPEEIAHPTIIQREPRSARLGRPSKTQPLFHQFLPSTVRLSPDFRICSSPSPRTSGIVNTLHACRGAPVNQREGIVCSGEFTI